MLVFIAIVELGGSRPTILAPVEES